MPKHRLIPHAVAVSTTLAAPLAYARNPFEFQTPVTPVAHDTLYIHDLFLAIIAVIFVIGISFLGYTLYQHRKSRGHRPASFTAPAGRLQWFWTFVPFLVLTFIDYVVMGIPAYHAEMAMANTKEGATLVVKATGSQWKWQYEYPEQGVKFTSNLSTPREQIESRSPTDPNYLLEVDHPLVLPVGEKVRILLASADVIHSWWVPSFGVKQDAVPGFLRETWVQIEKPGIYRGQCAELCGVGHAYMPIVVVAKTEPEFREWLAQAKSKQAAAAAESTRTFTMDQLVAAGKKVYDTNCLSCHQANGLGVPGAFPPIVGGHPFAATAQLTGELAKRGFYENGKIVVGPVSQHIGIVVHGIPGTAMPAFDSQLNDADIAAVVTYERNNFGNHTGDAVQPTEIKKARDSK